MSYGYTLQPVTCYCFIMKMQGENKMQPITRRITVPLSDDERMALRRVSDEQLRHPRDQIRYMLRVALGLTKEETVGDSFQAHPTVSK